MSIKREMHEIFMLHIKHNKSLSPHKVNINITDQAMITNQNQPVKLFM